MRVLLSIVLAAHLLASCDTQGAEPVRLPTDRVMVIVYEDSLFAVPVDDPTEAVTAHLAAGRFRVFNALTEGNFLAEEGAILLSADDRESRGALGDRVIRVSSQNPEQPVVLGDPSESIFQVHITASGVAYGLVLRDDASCRRGWAVIRLGEGTSEVLSCTGVDVLPFATQPQGLFVSDEEKLILIPFFPERVIIGDPMDVAVLRPALGAEIEIYREVTPAVYDVRYRASSGVLYSADFYTGAVFSLTPGGGGPTPISLGPTPVLSNRRLFLLDDVLLTFLRREGEGVTDVYTRNLATGARQTFEVPGEMVQAYEHDGYILFRPFEFDGPAPPVETFVGLCALGLGAAGPVQVETFDVALPAFTQETALLSHSLSCR